MAGYMYASELTARKSAMLRDQGMLPQMWWYNAAYQGKDSRQAAQALFSHNCNTCHTIGGLNDIRDRVRGRPPDEIAAIINHTGRMVPWMPPFSGNSRERELMAKVDANAEQWRDRLEPLRLQQIASYQYKLQTIRQTGDTIYMQSCSFCHGRTGLGDGEERGHLATPPERLVYLRADRRYIEDVLQNGTPARPCRTSRSTSGRD